MKALKLKPGDEVTVIFASGKPRSIEMIHEQLTHSVPVGGWMTEDTRRWTKTGLRHGVYGKDRVRIVPTTDEHRRALRSTVLPSSVAEMLGLEPPAQRGATLGNVEAHAASALPHGYPTDLDALRAIVRMYAERSLDALRAFHDAYSAFCEAACALQDPDPGPHQAAERACRLYDDAESALVGVWVERCLDEPWTPEPGAYNEAWLRTVEADMRARLAGDIGRPLPVPDTAKAGRAGG